MKLSLDRGRISYRYFVALIVILAVFFGNLIYRKFFEEFPRAELMFFFILLPVIYLISGLIVEPISRLNKGAERILAGDLNVRISLKSNDELGALAANLIRLTERAKESEEKFQRKNAELVAEEEKNDLRNKSLEDTKTALLNVLEDIEKEKRNSESLAEDLRKFKLAVENAYDQIMITDPDVKVLYANYAAESTTGYSISELLGNTPVLWRGQIPEDFNEKMWTTIREKKQPFSGEVNNRKKSGELYVAEFKISPIIGEAGNIKFYVILERDITKAKEVDRAKTEFVSLASHQLRTPLSIINWYAEMLMDGGVGRLNLKQEEHVEEIHRTNHRMIELVNALLNVSRMDMGTLPIEPKKFDLGEVSNNVIDELSRQMNLKNISLEKNYPASPIYLTADPNLVRIILQNIIANAVKYDRQGGNLSVVLSRQGEEILIKVSDNGIGIPAEQQPKIFTKLFRADNARKADPEGNGLGLYLTKAAVEKSGGRIWFESVENKGTNFFVALPVSATERSIG